MSFSFILSLFLSILLVTTTKLNLTNSLTSILFTLVAPINTPLTFVRRNKDQLINYLLQSPSLLSENTKLKNENNDLKITLKKYLEEIKDQTIIEQMAKTKWHVQPIKLVSLDNLITFTSRSFEKIQPGQPVISGNSLIGLVKSVNQPIIKVTPLRSPDIKISIQLETGAKGNYLYQHSEPTVINLDGGSVFNPKTLVFTLPNEQIPANLIVGQIERVTSNPANPTQEAVIKLDQEINTSSNFFIITQP